MEVYKDKAVEQLIVYIPVVDLARAQRFYAGVFGFDVSMFSTTKDPSGEMWSVFPRIVFDEEGNTIPSGLSFFGLGSSPHLVPSTDGTTPFLPCNDIKIGLEKVEEHGGRILQSNTMDGKIPLPNKVSIECFYALVIDTEGNKIGISCAEIVQGHKIDLTRRRTIRGGKIGLTSGQIVQESKNPDLVAMTTFTDLNFKEKVLQNDRLTMVDFWAEWCGPCRVIGPMIENLAEKYKERATIGKLNIEEQPKTAQAYAIKSIPTIIFFQDGEEVERIVGSCSEANLEATLNKYLAV